MADWYEEAARLLNVTSPINPVQYLSLPPDNNGVYTGILTEVIHRWLARRNKHH